MHPPAIAYDIARFFYAPHGGLRGIDRVEAAYGDHFFSDWPGDCYATLATPWGVRCFSRDIGLRVVRHALERWKENSRPEEDPVFCKARAEIVGAPERCRPLSAARSIRRHVAARVWDVTKDLGFALGGPAAKTLPQDAIFLSIGHIGIASEFMTGWLNRRKDIRAVFMIHDTIPIDRPELCSEAESRWHAKFISSAARYAHGVITTTETVRNDVIRHMHLSGRRDLEQICLPLPPAKSFQTAPRPDTELQRSGYFVFCSKIEPRKNLALLLNVWGELLRLGTRAVPKLVIVGSFSQQCAETAALLDRSITLKSHVIRIEGISSAGLACLIAGARALLSPSYAEGFGLPIIEALALGTPVIASDIPAHREVAQQRATYLSPIDGRGWADAIMQHAATESALREKARGYVPSTWQSYFQQLDPRLLTLGKITVPATCS
jgi:glycosyltransferase involved in cell wall biosynthesis